MLLLSSLGEAAANSKRMQTMKKNLELADEDIMEQSDTGSSDDPDDMLDEELGAKLKAQDGQVICAHIFVQSKRRHCRLIGTTLDSAAVLARNFSQKHQLPLK